METKEYRYIDKSEWARGEWDEEPDKVQWPDPKTGLPCLARRNEHTGNWCGYVGVSETHPWFEKPYDAELVDVSVHGGLTFSDHCHEYNKEHGICHLPAPGEPDNVWWFGFDCCHAFDLAPGLVATIKQFNLKGRLWPNDQYRNLDYVRAECSDLAQQLAAVP